MILEAYFARIVESFKCVLTANVAELKYVVSQLCARITTFKEGIYCDSEADFKALAKTFCTKSIES